jgi:hypothetical protein
MGRTWPDSNVVKVARLPKAVLVGAEARVIATEKIQRAVNTLPSAKNDKQRE